MSALGRIVLLTVNSTLPILINPHSIRKPSINFSLLANGVVRRGESRGVKKKKKKMQYLLDLPVSGLHSYSSLWDISAMLPNY